MRLFWKLKKSNDLKDIIIKILMIFVFSFTLFTNAIISISLALFFGLSIIFYFNNSQFKRVIKKNKKLFFLINGWIIFLFITLIYSENISYGFRIGFRYLNALFIGIVFFILIPRKIINKREIFYYAFVLSNIIFVFYIYYKAILVVEKTCYPEIYYNTFIEKINFILKKPNHVIFSCFHDQYKSSFFIHRVYNSMGFLFSILILINLIFKTTLKRNCFLLCLYFILIIIFSFLLFYQFSVVNVVLGIILIPAFTFIKTWKKHKKIIIIGIILVSFISVPVFIKYNFWSSNAIENQSIPAINFAKRVLTGEVNVNIDERFELNQANKFLIKENIIFGYGIGDVQDVLDGFYLSKKEDSRVYTEALKKHLNSHNNYAFLWLTGGLILLSAFLIQLFYAFNLSIKNKDWIFLFFLIIITLNLGFENVLSRISGLLFYVLFFNLFLHTTKLNKSY